MADKQSTTKPPDVKPIESTQTVPKPQPGDGIRSLQSTSVFRAINFELYAKPVNI